MQTDADTEAKKSCVGSVVYQRPTLLRNAPATMVRLSRPVLNPLDSPFLNRSSDGNPFAQQ